MSLLFPLPGTPVCSAPDNLKSVDSAKASDGHSPVPLLMLLQGILGQGKPPSEDVPLLQVLPAWTGYTAYFQESTQRGRNKEEALFHLGEKKTHKTINLWHTNVNSKTCFFWSKV